MEQFILSNEPEHKRVASLEALSEGMEEMDYAVFLSQEELTARKHTLSTLVIQESRLQEKKKEIVAEIKAEMKPIQNEKNSVLAEIKSGSVSERGICYKIIDENTRMVGYYNTRGQLVLARPMTQEDGQRTLKLASSFQ